MEASQRTTRSVPSGWLAMSMEKKKGEKRSGFWLINRLADPSRLCTSLHRKHSSNKASFKHWNCCTLSWIYLFTFCHFPQFRKMHLHEWTKLDFLKVVNVINVTKPAYVLLMLCVRNTQGTMKIRLKPNMAQWSIPFYRDEVKRVFSLLWVFPLAFYIYR